MLCLTCNIQYCAGLTGKLPVARNGNLIYFPEVSIYCLADHIYCLVDSFI